MTNIKVTKLIDFKRFWNLDNHSKPSYDSIFMQMSLLVSARSTCLRARFGAIITKRNKVIGVGFNGSISGTIECADRLECRLDSNGSCFDSIHAEQNAIANCIRNGISLEDSTIYVKSIPCLSCAKLIVASGIKRYVCIDDEYRIKDGLNYLIENKIPIDIMRMEID